MTAGGIVHVEAFHQITKLDNPLSSEVIMSWDDEVKPKNHPQTNYLSNSPFDVTEV